MTILNKKGIKQALYGVIILVGALLNPVLQAHFFHLEQWTKDGETIYLFSDYHICTQEPNKVYHKQQNAVIEIAQTLKAKVIAEDSFVTHEKLFLDPLHFNTNNCVMDLQFFEPIDEATSPLSGFASLCYKKGIPRVNIECRLAKVASIRAEILNELHPAISARTVFEVLRKDMDVIKNFNDGAVCNKYYAQAVAKVEKDLRELAPFYDLFSNSEKSIRELLEDPIFVQIAIEKMIECGLHEILYGESYYRDASSKLQELRANPIRPIHLSLVTFDLRLLDCFVMRAICSLEKKPILFVCLGATHAKSIRPLLKDLGYQGTCLAGAEWSSYFEDVNEFIRSEPKAIADITSCFSK